MRPDIDKKVARIKVRTLRTTGMVSVEFFMVLERIGWKINFIRDPERVEFYLDRLAATQDADKVRKITMELKGESGLPDLDIRERLKAHKRKAVFGS